MRFDSVQARARPRSHVSRADREAKQPANTRTIARREIASPARGSTPALTEIGRRANVTMTTGTSDERSIEQIARAPCAADRDSDTHTGRPRIHVLFVQSVGVVNEL